MKPTNTDQRQRLLNTLKAKPVDRVPISPFIYLNSIYEFCDYEPQIDTYWSPPDFDFIGKYVEFCDHFGFDIMHPLGTVWDFYGMNTALDRSVLGPAENWDVSVEDSTAGQTKHRIVNITTPQGSLRHVENYKKVSRYLVVAATEEYLIKTVKDFEIFREYSPSGEDMDCSLIDRAKAAVGNRGLLASNGVGAFNVLNSFRKLDDVLIDPILDEGFYREMIEFFLERIMRRSKETIRHGVDVLEISANLATSQVGPKFFRDYVMEYETRLLNSIHEAGIPNIYHNCGDAANIMHLYNEMPIDCWGYVTPPPFGDVELDEALRVIRPDMTLRGNIDQVEFLMHASPQQVKERVRDLLVKVRPRGNWILSTTDFFSDGTPYENIEAFAQAGRQYGEY